MLFFLVMSFSRGSSLAFAVGAYLSALLWSPVLFVFIPRQSAEDVRGIDES